LSPGAIRGQVRSAAGGTQLGAVVSLFNRSERLVGRVITNDKGEFGFSGLLPDQYSIRVSLASFMPAVKRSILVQPGMQSLLAIRLTSVISTIELTSTIPAPSMMMSDEWTWALRASAGTRPVLRALPGKTRAVRRADSRGMLRVSAGDLGPLALGGSTPDVGTGFSLVTPLDGLGDLRVSGNVGYVADSGAPVAGFRTSWTRDSGARVHMTLQQLNRPGQLLSGGGAPALRVLSLGTYDHVRPHERIAIEYGASLESAMFFDRITYLSGFARGSFDLTKNDRIQAAMNHGSAPLDLLIGDPEMRDSAQRDSAQRDSAQRDLAALSVMPRFSVMGGQTRIQRSRNFELGYQRKLGSRTLAFNVHRETIQDTVGTIAGSSAPWQEGLIQDLGSRNFLTNVGRYRSQGVIGSVTQRFGERFDATLAFGHSGVLSLREQAREMASANELRDNLQVRMRNWAALRVQTLVPVAGTRVSASYQWTEARALTPTHLYLTQPLPAEAGLNIRLKQPVPRFLGMPGRLEMTGEFRNLLAEGYLPLTLQGGQKVLLIHSPRAMRGGFAYIF
jgi:hypothetical protein